MKTAVQAALQLLVLHEFIMLVFQMGAQYGVQYGSRSAMRGQPAGAPMMISREMAAATGQMPGGGPIPSQQSSIVYRRPAPYGNHQQVLMHRKPQYSASMPVNPVSNSVYIDRNPRLIFSTVLIE